MTICYNIRDKKLQFDINSETAKILPSNQRQIIEQAKFTYSPSAKAFEKQTEKQVGAIKSLKPSNKKMN